MAYMTIMDAKGEEVDVLTRSQIACCSRWHGDNDNDGKDCYHCNGSDFCGCSSLDREEKYRQDQEFIDGAMRCWCGACEDEYGAPIHPAPCARSHWNKMADLAAQDAEMEMRF
jgi:hypothetical protein